MHSDASSESEDVPEAGTPHSTARTRTKEPDPEKLRQEIDSFKKKLETLNAESSGDQNYLINAYKRCIYMRQCLLDRAGDPES